eukprot:7207622-Ditylum_brightwellii.AAC.1
MSFVPLHKTAFEVHPPLREWIVSWTPWETEFLDATGWFECGHDIDGGSYYKNALWYPHLKPGVFVWEPSPAAAAAAIDELRKAQHKQ